MIYLKSIRTWIFIIYVLLVISLSLTPGPQLNMFSNLWKYDKFIHFIEYFGLGFLLVNMLILEPVNNKRIKYLILFLLLFPVFDELLQHYTPTRISDIQDAIIDIIGGLCGSYVRNIFHVS